MAICRQHAAGIKRTYFKSDRRSNRRNNGWNLLNGLIRQEAPV
jgi:hypothetical protein